MSPQPLEYSLCPENGHWLIGDKFQNVGGFKTSEAELGSVPRADCQWLYDDGAQWSDQVSTITVEGLKELLVR